MGGVIIGFIADYCIDAPLLHFCPERSAYPLFDIGSFGQTPLFVDGDKDSAAVRTDAEGIATAPRIIAGEQPLESFVGLYFVPQDTPFGEVRYGFPPDRFQLKQVLAAPIPTAARWASFTLGMILLVTGAAARRLQRNSGLART
jgi:hypothetical protein